MVEAPTRVLPLPASFLNPEIGTDTRQATAQRSSSSCSLDASIVRTHESQTLSTPIPHIQHHAAARTQEPRNRKTRHAAAVQYPHIDSSTDDCTMVSAASEHTRARDALLRRVLSFMAHTHARHKPTYQRRHEDAYTPAQHHRWRDGPISVGRSGAGSQSFGFRRKDSRECTHMCRSKTAYAHKHTHAGEFWVRCARMRTYTQVHNSRMTCCYCTSRHR